MADTPEGKIQFKGSCPDCGQRKVDLPGPLPDIGDDFDWLVRDYDGFRFFMLEELAARFPQRNRWTPADVETTLIEGSVSLNTKGGDFTKGIILKPGQKAVYSNGQMNINEADIELATNWTKRGFNFKNTSFKDLVIRLERWYNVDIIILSEEVKDFSFTGKFRNNETIWQVLDVIKMTTPIDYKSDDDKIYITLITD